MARPLTDDEEDYLKGIYFNPKHPNSYQSPLRLFKFVQKDGQHSITLKQVEEWMKKQESYTLNRNV